MRPCPLCGETIPATWNYAVCEPCGKKPCRHGKRPGECNPCDIESDRAYDAAREGRMFR